MPDKNKIFNKLMIATDLDGTLITPAYKIPEPNFKAVDDFIKGGGLFTIATGRSIESARQYAKAIKVDVYKRQISRLWRLLKLLNLNILTMQ